MKNLFKFDYISLVDSYIEVMFVSFQCHVKFFLPVCQFRRILSNALRTSSVKTSFAVNGVRLSCSTSDLARLEVMLNRLIK